MRVGQLLPNGRRTRLTIATVAWVLLGLATLGILARHYPAAREFTLGVVAATPYLVLGAPIGLALLLLARQWPWAVVAAFITVLAVSTQTWLYTSDPPPKNAIQLHVMTSNLHDGGADANAVVAAVRRNRVGVLMLEELTEPERQRLKAAGLDELLPYHASRRAPGASGTGLWSRYPLSKVDFIDGYTYKFVTAKLWLRNGNGWLNVQAVALHLSGPVPHTDLWQRDIRHLAAALPSAGDGRPLIVGGDFNATPDTVQFRDVLDAGFRDAADQAGAGYTRTFPSDEWYPPLIAIDHVLTRGGPVATAVHTVEIPHTDHRALVATIAVPRR